MHHVYGIVYSGSNHSVLRNNELLYVGCSVDPWKRFYEHCYGRGSWEVQQISREVTFSDGKLVLNLFQTFNNRGQAEREEKCLIIEHNAPLNIHCTYQGLMRSNELLAWAREQERAREQRWATQRAIDRVSDIIAGCF